MFMAINPRSHYLLLVSLLQFLDFSQLNAAYCHRSLETILKASRTPRLAAAILLQAF